eukprot:COSAG06_NODE_24418_length_663_cov_1.239362_1_plen_63_part_01
MLAAAAGGKKSASDAIGKAAAQVGGGEALPASDGYAQTTENVENPMAYDTSEIFRALENQADV